MHTILLVEGIEIARNTLAKGLARAGFEVLQASSGAEAQALLEAYTREVDLLITEAQLEQGMTGVSLFSRVKADRPRMKVLYLSRGPLIESSVTFLVRPFGLEEFMRRVGRVLNRRAADRRSSESTLAVDGAQERRRSQRRDLRVSLITLNPPDRERVYAQMRVTG